MSPSHAVTDASGSAASPPPLPPAVHLRGALGMIALYFVLQLLVSGVAGLVAGLVAGFGAGMHGTRTQPHVWAEQMRRLFSQPDANAVVVMVTLLATGTIILLLVRRWWPRLWLMAQPPGVGLPMPGNPAFFGVAALCGLALPIVGSWLTQWLAQGHEVTQDIRQLGGATSLGLRIPLALVVVSVGPLVEELLFRGLLLSSLLRHMRPAWAVGLSSLLFAAVHLPDLGYLWYAVPNLALLAAVLAWLRLRSGSLWPAVLAHGVNNALAVVTWFVVLPAG